MTRRLPITIILHNNNISHANELLHSNFLDLKYLSSSISSAHTRSGGVPAYIVSEVTQLAQLFWNFKDADGPRSVIGHAGNMQNFASARDWLAGPALVRDLKVSFASIVGLF